MAPRQHLVVMSKGGRPSSAAISIDAVRAALAISGLVEVIDTPPGSRWMHTLRCARCHMSVKVPDVSFDPQGVCSACLRFERERDRIGLYFRTQADLAGLLSGASKRAGSKYDCLVLFSGGKDSTYMLCRLVEQGYSILSLTLDNGFLSAGALANIDRINAALGTDHLTLKPHNFKQALNDSIDRHATPCRGCFKGILDGALRVAVKHHIPFIATGLSRGQIAEERLQWFFDRNIFDPETIDAQLRRARPAYHYSENNEGNPYWGRDLGNMAADVELIDYYRYDSATRFDIMGYLGSRRAIWQEPYDCGFCSTNCQINDVGVILHQRHYGWHNYEIVTAWDVRLGHLSLDAAGQDLRVVEDKARLAGMFSALGRMPFDNEHDERQEIHCRVKPYVTDRQVASVLDRSVPGWHQIVRIAYAEELAPAGAQAWAAQPFLTETMRQRQLAVLPTLADSANLTETVVLQPVEEIDHATLGGVLLNVLLAEQPARSVEYSRVGVLRHVDLRALPSARHWATLELLKTRIDTANDAPRIGVQAVICRRSEGHSPWIILAGPSSRRAWRRWLTLLANLDDTLGGRAIHFTRGTVEEKSDVTSSPALLLPSLLCLRVAAPCLQQAPDALLKVLAGVSLGPITNGRVEFIDYSGNACILGAEYMQVLMAGLPDEVAYCGIRVVGAGQICIEAKKILALSDMCGRWPAPTSGIQIIVEAGDALGRAIVHSDLVPAVALQAAQAVVSMLQFSRGP